MGIIKQQYQCIVVCDRSCMQIASGWSTGLNLLHCEGYCLYRPQLAKEMMTIAKAAGALVSMDLASFEVRG